MRASESLDQLLPALVAARGLFYRFAKDQTADTGKYTYRYGDLAALFDATVPALLEHGLMLTQAVDVDEAIGLVLVSRLWHVSGQWLESRYPLPRYDRPQEQGSAITYARRYAAAPLLGVAAEEDDDGAQAQQSAPVTPAHAEGDVWPVQARIVGVEDSPTRTGTIRYTVRLSDGTRATTISQKLGRACHDAAGDERDYLIDLKQTAWGVDIKSLSPLEAPAAPAPADPPATGGPTTTRRTSGDRNFTADDIPF